VKAFRENFDAEGLFALTREQSANLARSPLHRVRSLRPG
jgi:hypothetical protein